jgi:hypothetical protein
MMGRSCRAWSRRLALSLPYLSAVAKWMRKFVGMVGGVKVDGGGASLSCEGGSAMATGVAGTSWMCWKESR